MGSSSDFAVETDVLIVGSGPAGASSALFLATYGVDHMVVTKHRWTANTPRAHITNQRTVEIFRDMGIESEILAEATPHHLMGDTVFCTSLVGDEIGRVRTWGTHPAREADWAMASPSPNCDLPQTFLEPIIINHAAARSSVVRFSTEYVSLEQHEDCVIATVRDRLTDSLYRIKAKYLIGADGGKSAVASDIGLPMEGQMDVAGSMNIVFEADLTKYVERRPSVLYWVIQPGADIGGIGLGLIRMVRPWNQWLIVWGYDISQPAPIVDDAKAISIVRNLVGDPNLEVKIQSTSLWGNNKMYATSYRRGRVFCMGDAVHRHPPSNGLGSNTSIQDAYNLAWKLKMVLDGTAGEALLDSYEAERVPIGRQIVLRANKSIDEFGAILEALGLVDTSDQAVMAERIAARVDNSLEGLTRRQALAKALELKNYEFNAHGVEMGQRYRSLAIAPDGTEEPKFERDPELYYHPTTWPGARIPHVWLARGNEKVSTLDLVGKGRFSLLTGICGEVWADAARKVSSELGVELEPFVIGPGREVNDVYDDWYRAREVEEDGCIVVRPDGHVAWRSHSMVDDPVAALSSALRSVLAR